MRTKFTTLLLCLVLAFSGLAIAQVKPTNISHSLEVTGTSLILRLKKNTTTVLQSKMASLIQANSSEISKQQLTLIIHDEAQYPFIISLLDELQKNKITNFQLTDTSGAKWPYPTVAEWDAGEFLSKAFIDSLKTSETHYVLDLEAIFSQEQKAALDSLVSAYEKQSSDEIVILTIAGEWSSQEQFEHFITQMHKQFGVGKKGANNGVLIGISTSYRMIRISNGYGIEPRLSDAETKAIIDEVILPSYKKGDYFEGTRNGVLALIQKLSVTSKKQ